MKCAWCFTCAYILGCLAATNPGSLAALSWCAYSSHPLTGLPSSHVGLLQALEHK